MQHSKKDCEQIRQTLKNEFETTVRQDWIDKGLWMNPASVKFLLGREKGKRENQHIVDLTHIIAQRSLVAGFMEGNTSTTRSWFKFAHPDKDLNSYRPVKEWMQNLNERCLAIGTSSNLYHALSQGYEAWSTFDTACIYIDELPKGPHFTVLGAGTYYLMNDNTGTANVLIREFPMSVKNLVETYGKKKNGKWDWSNFSDRVKSLYENQAYNVDVTVAEMIKPNNLFTNDLPEGGSNRKWVSLTYECAGTTDTGTYGIMTKDMGGFDDDKFLRIQHRTRKPFIAFRNQSSNNFAYGEVGPTTYSLGCIRSLNKKAVSKDIALDLMIRPPMQGPANLKKSYMNTNPSAYVPLDAHAMAQGGAKQLFQVNPAIATLNADVQDLRSMIEKMYYSDYMLFLSRNPKTRTAAEVNAIVSEQQLVIGPALQSLDYTLNNPLVDFLADYAMFEDPYVGEVPEELAGSSLRTVFISVFAQAQRAADLPSIDRYMAMVTNVGQINPTIFDKADLDKLADLYEDRLYLPAGLNRSQDEVDARREKNQQDAQRQQMLNETVPALAGASRDVAQAKQMQEREVQAL